MKITGPAWFVGLLTMLWLSVCGGFLGLIGWAIYRLVVRYT